VRIGVDFDNTIVSYDSVFHRVAFERGLVPIDLPPTKLGVRDHLRRSGREELWTEMQGYVYGTRMDEAAAYPGAIEFFSWARDAGIGLSIISHKTRRPFLGPEYDLHEAARGWVRKFLMAPPRPLIDESCVYFELTKEDKLARISSENLDYFIDDLPEILTASGFPARTAGLLFDPEGAFGGNREAPTFGSWPSLKSYLEKHG
jgi:hypothetical protein